MNDLRIKYSGSVTVRSFVLISSVAYAAFGFYISVTEALNSNYGFSFIAGLLIILVSVILILSFTIWRSKPLLVIDSDKVIANFANQKHLPEIDWSTVTEVGVGISYLRFTVNGSSIDMDLSALVYSDLRTVKSKIIELCESKNIPYHSI